MRFAPILLAACVAALAAAPSTVATSASSHTARAAARPCKVTIRKVKGKKRRVTVCHYPPPAVMPIISRGVPAFASTNIQPNSAPTYANDDNYATYYRSDGVPAWVAYDLSAIPTSRRHRVLAVYYNYSYAYNIIHGYHYNNLGAYSIQGNNSPGGRSPPDDGWKTLVSVDGNTLHSRQHIFNLRGYNWVRIFVTQSDGSIQNSDADFNQFDIYDLSRVKSPTDDWIFYGDSITAGAMVTSPDSGVGPFAELIHRADGRRWPVAEDAGEPFDTSTEGVAHLLGGFSSTRGTGYLSIFPGKYVVLAYGMNDAASVSNGRDYYNNLRAMVRAVIARGKIPVIPTISYTNNAAYNRQIPILNAKVGQLYKAYPQIVKGPDFWTYFRQHPDLIGAGDIHPTSLGYAAMRQLWARTMLTEVYQERSG